MVNVNKLKGKMVENGLTMEALAKKIGINRSSLYRKMSGGCKTMLLEDANSIATALNLSAEETMSIFFSHFVA
jgi:transcriptional regulator with XRE-family HTH domain